MVDNNRLSEQCVRETLASVEAHLRRILAEQCYGEIHVNIKNGKVVIAGQSSSQFDAPQPK